MRVSTKTSAVAVNRFSIRTTAKIIAVLIMTLCFITQSGYGQLITEPFNYTASGTSGLAAQSSSAWAIVNTGDSILVTSGSLSYSGLPASTGNKIAFDGAGTDYNRPFTSQSTAGSTVYYSFILNVSALGSLSATPSGAYFTGLASSSTTFGGIVHTRKSSVDATKYNIGVAQNTASTIAWSSTDYSVGTAYFIVVGYQIVSGLTNDVAKLWVNPATGGSTEPAVTATGVWTTGSDLSAVSQVFLRQNSTSATPFIEMDEIRVGTTWASVTPSGGTPTISTSGALSAVNTTYGTPSATTSFNVSGANMTTGITVAAPTGYEVSLTSGGTYTSSVTVGSSGTISSTPVFVRLSATASVAASPYSNNLVCSSTGATSVNVPTVSSSVSPAALTVTASNQTKSYNTTLSLGTSAFTSSGLKNSETIGAVTLSDGGAAATATTNAGTYTITSSAATGGTFTASNYSITYASGTLTITKGNQTITFNALVNKTTADAPFTLNGTASSGLTVTYISSNTAVATVSGSTVTIMGQGTTNITASQAGDGNWNAASDVVRSQLVNPASLQNQTITFNALSAVTYGDAPFTLSGTASSGLTVTYASSNTAVATVSGNTVTIIAPGNTVITASQAGDGTYNPAPDVTQPLLVNVKNLTVTATANNKAYDGNTTATISVSAVNGIVGSDLVSATGGGTFASANTGTGISVTASLSLTGTDAVKYSLTQPAGLTADITPASQTITFAALAPKTFGNAKFKLTATASSGLAVSYNSSNSLVATIVGDSVTITGGGSTTITASQAGNSNYAAATPVNQVQVVNKANQTISFTAIPTKNIESAPFALVATASSGLAVTFASNTTSIVTVSGSTATVTGTRGTGSISASQSGNTNYNPANDSINTFTVTGPILAGWPTTWTGTTLSPSAATTLNTGVNSGSMARVGLTAGSSSTRFSSSNWSAANYLTIAVTPNTGYTLNLNNESLILSMGSSNTGPNLYTLYSSVDNYTTALGTYSTSCPSLQQSGTVTFPSSGYNNLTGITFRVLGNTIGCGGTFASSGTGGPSVITLIGTTTAPVTPVITSSLSSSATVGTAYNYAITATNNPISYSASGLPAGLSVNTSTGVISGTPSVAGTFNVTIGASNGSNGTATLVLTVAMGNQTITFNTLTAKTFGDAPFTLNGTASSGLTVSYVSSNTSVATVFGNTVTIVGAGSTTITASQAGSANWNAATSVNQTLTVNKANQTITFNALPDRPDTDAPFSLTATSTSGLAISYVSSNASVATVSGNTVTIVAAGNTTITASQAGNLNYNAATSVSNIQVITSTALQDQTITFDPLSPVTYGDIPFDLQAFSTSGLNISYTSSNTAVATVSGITVTIVGAGNTTITANQIGNASYNPAPPVSRVLTVDKATLTVTATANNKVYDGTNAATISNIQVFGIIGSDNVTVGGNGSFTDVNVGINIPVFSNLSLSGPSAGNYLIDPPTNLAANITQASQTITFGTLPVKVATDAPFSLTGSASSGLAVTYTSSATNVATVSGSTVTITGPGSTTITATQAGNTNYTAATSVQQVLTVNPAPTTVTWNFGTTTATAAPTGGVPVTNLTIGNISQGNNANTSQTTIQINTTSPSGTYAGATGLMNVATTAANASFNSATSAYFEFTLTPASGKSVTISGLTFGSRSTTSGPTSIDIRSSLDNYASAISTSTVLTGSLWALVSPSFSAVTSTGSNPITLRIYGYVTGGLNNLGTNGGNNWKVDDISLTVYTSTLPAPVITSSLTATGVVGTAFNYSITATNTPSTYTATPLPAGLTLSGNTISGTPTTAGVTNVTLTATSGSGSDTKILVTTISKGNQTITFNSIPAKTYGDASFSLNATASSGLAITYISSNSSVATVSGNVVTILAAGTTTITASQAGDVNWNAASNVAQVLTVNKASQTITFAALADKNDTDVPFTLNGTSSSGLTVTYISSNSAVATVSGNTVTITGPGSTTITASQSGNANYNAAADVSQIQLVINTSLQNQTITFNALSPVIYGDAPFALNGTASSGLTVTYTSSNTSVATVSGNTVTILSPGTTNITASQAGDGTYNPAPNVTQSLLVATKTLTISGTVAQNKVFDSTTVAIITGGTLNGIIGSDIVTFSGGGSFASSNAGTGIAVTANLILGGANASKYNLIQPAGLSANITQAAQSISFPAFTTHLSTDGTFALTATASSGLAVTYSSSNTAVATVSGTNITITGPGTAIITASQGGDNNYSAATAVTQSLHVLAVVAKWTFEGVTTANIGASPVTTTGSYIADLGTQTTGSQFSGVHASPGTTWSNITGNNSAKSLSANTWAVGDYFQFKVDLTGYYSIVLKYDQTGSNTGPVSFKLQYSLNGTSFTDYQSYNIPTNGTAGWSWSATTLRNESVQLFDLSSVTALNGQSTVYFRVVDNGTTAINGTTVATGGTSRIDNFTVISEQCPITINTGVYGPTCSNASSITLNGTPSGGIWTGTGVSGSVGSGYTFNPASGTQTLTYTYDNGTCAKSATTVITVNTPPVVSFSGFSGASYCLNGTATLTANQTGGIFSGNGITNNGSGTATWSAAAAGAGTHTITYTFNNGTCSNSTTQTVTVIVCNSTVIVKAFIEGFYTGSNLMAATLSDLGVITNDATATDTIQVNLWSAASLSNALPDYSQKVILHTNGVATGGVFPGATLGNSYYIAIKHRNSIETWSAAPVLITSVTEYDFRSSLTSAYSDGVNPPMKSLGAGVYSIYSGDVNQDGTVDGADQATIENDASNFVFGYNPSDCTGDGATDSGDQTIIENNANMFLFYARPF